MIIELDWIGRDWTESAVNVCIVCAISFGPIVDVPDTFGPCLICALSFGRAPLEFNVQQQ